MSLYKKQIPLVLTFIITVSLLINYFFNLGETGSAYEGTILSFSQILLSASLGLGIINISRSHLQKIEKRDGVKWLYSIIFFVSMITIIVVGVAYGADSTEFTVLFENFLSPLSATAMALFPIWIVPALFRKARVRNIEGGFLVLGLILVILGGTPVGSVIWKGFTPISDWLSSVPGMASQRGMKITMALGVIMLSIRIILGRESSWLRKEAGE